ncbi:hypothetical protein L596_025308 [Steinernema carpocapsae]|uniref:C-type lectin domain-containing protein n=1 Tax=Steinernema carpocapsae TaxID=34508 RepID=A0A4U5M7E3_STECR|nr:hypothetical protein L596_025308 [Steinernema carpocapsae]
MTLQLLCLLITLGFLFVRSSRVCGAGWITSQDQLSCYLVVPVELPVDGAQQTCEAFNSKLASVFNDEDNRKIAETAQAVLANVRMPFQYWLGASRIANTNDWTWNDSNSLEYSNWALDQPTDISYENCLKVNSKWLSDNCDSARSFVCKMDATRPKSTCPHCSFCTTTQTLEPCPTSPPCEVCPDKWTKFQGYEYFFNKEIMIFSEAEAFCVAQGGHLTSVHSQAENDFLTALFFNSTDRSQVGGWLGGFSLSTDKLNFMWTDGSSWDYTNWIEGQPDVSRYEENRVEFYANWRTRQIKWVVDFSTRIQPFFCKRRVK